MTGCGALAQGPKWRTRFEESNGELLPVLLVVLRARRWVVLRQLGAPKCTKVRVSSPAPAPNLYASTPPRVDTRRCCPNCKSLAIDDGTLPANRLQPPLSRLATIDLTNPGQPARNHLAILHPRRWRLVWAPPPRSEWVLQFSRLPRSR